MSIETYVRDKVVRVIESCYNIDHLKSCRHWVEYMIARNIIRDMDTLNILFYELGKKERSLEIPPKFASTPPHLARRALRIAEREEESGKLLKLVPPAKESQYL